MKYLNEYRNVEATKGYLNLIEKSAKNTWNIMEICGGQTHGLVKNGILDLLPKQVRMIHGPGCPVCVTPLNLMGLRKQDNQGHESFLPCQVKDQECHSLPNHGFDLRKSP
jgi:hydrogenase expression/formation protein HypD